jgi:hypothetical protein
MGDDDDDGRWYKEVIDAGYVTRAAAVIKITSAKCLL